MEDCAPSTSSEVTVDIELMRCGLCHDVYVDPCRMICCGKTYCRICIVLKSQCTCAESNGGLEGNESTVGSDTVGTSTGDLVDGRTASGVEGAAASTSKDGTSSSKASASSAKSATSLAKPSTARKPRSTSTSTCLTSSSYVPDEQLRDLTMELFPVEAAQAYFNKLKFCNKLRQKGKLRQPQLELATLSLLKWSNHVMLAEDDKKIDVRIRIDGKILKPNQMHDEVVVVEDTVLVYTVEYNMEAWILRDFLKENKGINGDVIIKFYTKESVAVEESLKMYQILKKSGRSHDGRLWLLADFSWKPLNEVIEDMPVLEKECYETEAPVLKAMLDSDEPRMMQMGHDMVKMGPEMVKMTPEMMKMPQEMIKMDPQALKMGPDMVNMQSQERFKMIQLPDGKMLIPEGKMMIHEGLLPEQFRHNFGNSLPRAEDFRPIFGAQMGTMQQNVGQTSMAHNMAENHIAPTSIAYNIATSLQNQNMMPISMLQNLPKLEESVAAHPILAAQLQQPSAHKSSSSQAKKRPNQSPITSKPAKMQHLERPSSTTQFATNSQLQAMLAGAPLLQNMSVNPRNGIGNGQKSTVQNGMQGTVAGVTVGNGQKVAQNGQKSTMPNLQRTNSPLEAPLLTPESPSTIKIEATSQKPTASSVSNGFGMVVSQARAVAPTMTVSQAMAMSRTMANNKNNGMKNANPLLFNALKGQVGQNKGNINHGKGNGGQNKVAGSLNKTGGKGQNSLNGIQMMNGMSTLTIPSPTGFQMAVTSSPGGNLGLSLGSNGSKTASGASTGSKASSGASTGASIVSPAGKKTAMPSTTLMSSRMTSPVNLSASMVSQANTTSSMASPANIPASMASPVNIPASMTSPTNLPSPSPANMAFFQQMLSQQMPQFAFNPVMLSQLQAFPQLYQQNLQALMGQNFSTSIFPQPAKPKKSATVQPIVRNEPQPDKVWQVYNSNDECKKTINQNSVPVSISQPGSL